MKKNLQATFTHKGQELPLYDLEMERARRCHYYIRPYTLPGAEKTEEIAHCFEDEEIEAILAMPKVGTRISLGEAYCRMAAECFDETGDLVSFEPCDPKNLPDWCCSHGYYIEPDEGELIKLDCTLLDYLSKTG